MNAKTIPVLGRDHAGSDVGAGRAAAARMTVTYCPVNRLKLDPNNPRIHGPRQIRQIARSIKTFGFNVPVLVDANLKVIAEK